MTTNHSYRFPQIGRWPLFFFALLISFFARAQNFDKLGSKDAIKVSGGIGFNAIGYASDGISVPSREPFTWYTSGSLNLSILDVSLPFTFTYSNQGGKFTQPFNRTAFHPSYKWVKGHVGMISMNFSPYTLTGHLFLGGGLELTPGKWKIQVMSGRLVKPIEYSVADDNINDFSYGRFGYGLKTEYNAKKWGAHFTFFKAKDNTASLDYVPLNSQVSPQDNLVFSFGGNAKITKQLSLDAEYALSGLTQNINDLILSESGSSVSFLDPVISGNSTTSYYSAFNSNLAYKMKVMSIAIKFEHVDPGYKTLGGYYFNNDLRNLTIAPSFTLFKNRLNIGLNTGFQQNNLKGDKTTTTKRWIGSANVSFVPVSAIVITGMYSNFSTFSRNRPATDPFYYAPADTLNFYQITQTASGMIAYNFGKKKVRNVLQLIYNYNESMSLSGAINEVGLFGINSTEETAVPAKVHTSNLSYTMQFKPYALGINIAANMNRTDIMDQVNDFFGPTVNLQKSLFKKKVNTSVGATYNLQYQNGEQLSNVMNYRAVVSYAPQTKESKFGKFNLSANANLLQRFPTSASTSKITELNVFLNLGYSF